MNNRTKWILNKVRLGWGILTVGACVAVTGLIMQFRFADLPYNMRIITGLGIMLIGIGVGVLLRYRSALKNERSASRLNVEERDERTVQIRARAGNRAFWVAIGCTYAGLMWSSFAANGSLPEPGGDALWNFLAAAVLIPFSVYIVSILLDERNF
jgi:ABC-type uncharacterized transport system permease subunit